MDASIQLFALITLIITFVVNALVRRTPPPQRPIRALEALTNMTGESIEASRPLHVSLGQASLGNDSTLLSMVGKEFIYYLVREVSVGDTRPIFTVAETAAIPLALSTLRRAYEDEKRPNWFHAENGRWYPSGARSLAYAAAIMAMHEDDQVSGNMLVGRYGTELALILDISNRKGKPSFAVSDSLEGQAIAYALANEVLIGEEVFAAPAYLSHDNKLLNRNTSMDILRYLLVLTIIVLAILSPIMTTLNGSN